MKILLPLLMLFVAMPSWAERLFDVEVIIFKRNIDAESVNESWPNTVASIDYTNTGSLNSPTYTAEKGVTLLPHSMFELNTQEQRLRNHAGFQVLLHTAWRQGDNGPATAPTFHLSSGRNYAGMFQPTNVESEPTSATSTTSVNATSDSLDATRPAEMEFEGKLKIYVQHYLFADAEFDLRAPATRKIELNTSNAIDSPVMTESTTQFGNLEAIDKSVETEHFIKTYRFDQKRKMRSGETHYFDHPLLGMIIQVRKAN